MGFLIYQFPNNELKSFVGEWHKTTIENIPNDKFFVSDFTKKEVYYFEIEAETKIDKEFLSYNSDDSVFEVDGKFYLNGLQYFIDGFEENEIEKAIYSRIKRVEKGESNISEFISRLAEKYHQQALVYLISDSKFGTWVGATPEVLLSGNDEKLFSMALAGTKSDENTDWTEKEIEEHQYVIDFIKDKIELYSPSFIEIEETKTVKAGAVYHLRTDFSFHISKEKWNDLIDSLHPTPAVCGTPMETAKEYILKFEPHDRAFYTGLIGWKGKEDLNVYVNLRCMQVLENYYALYVGGGITLSSNIGDEWKETERKSETLLSLI